MKPYFHLSIGVRSLEETIDFYTRVLKASIQHRDPSGYVNIDFFGTQITLKESSNINSDLPEFHFGINLGYVEFDELAENIITQNNQCVMMQPKMVDVGTPLERKKMYVKCPSGYLIELKGYKKII